MIELSRLRVVGPLEPFSAGFAGELERQGYTPSSAERQLLLMAHLSRWLAGEGLDCGALSLADGERFLAARRAAGYAHHRSVKAIRPLLAYLQGIGVAPAPAMLMPEDQVEELLWRYRGYLAVERGLRPDSVDLYFRMVRPFLEGRRSREGLELERLSAGEVSSFVVAHCTRLGRAEAKITVTALRSLLGFLHLEGVVGQQGLVERPRHTGTSHDRWTLAAHHARSCAPPSEAPLSATRRAVQTRHRRDSRRCSLFVSRRRSSAAALARQHPRRSRHQ
jgi:hypothetical protein